jgi:hypothetical protein
MYECSRQLKSSSPPRRYRMTGGRNCIKAARLTLQTERLRGFAPNLGRWLAVTTSTVGSRRREQPEMLLSRSSCPNHQFICNHWHRGSSITITTCLQRGSSVCIEDRFCSLSHRRSSAAISMPFRKPLHRESSVSIAATLHRGSSISISTSLGGTLGANACSAN